MASSNCHKQGHFQDIFIEKYTEQRDRNKQTVLLLVGYSEACLPGSRTVWPEPVYPELTMQEMEKELGITRVPDNLLVNLVET